jgi:hypothetical protein
VKTILLSLAASTVLFAQASNSPQINGTTVSDSPSQITVSGVRFGSAKPIVTVDALPLFVVNFTDSVVVASLPSLPSGTYALSVENTQNHQVGSSAVTVGGAGPQGQTGPVGPTGPQGVKGDTGAENAVLDKAVHRYVDIRMKVDPEEPWSYVTHFLTEEPGTDGHPQVRGTAPWAARPLAVRPAFGIHLQEAQVHSKLELFFPISALESPYDHLPGLIFPVFQQTRYVEVHEQNMEGACAGVNKESANGRAADLFRPLEACRDCA